MASETSEVEDVSETTSLQEQTEDKEAKFLQLVERGEYLIVKVTLSGILKVKQKLGRTFNSDKLGGIAFTKISKLTMCSA